MRKNKNQFKKFMDKYFNEKDFLMNKKKREKKIEEIVALIEYKKRRLELNK